MTSANVILTTVLSIGMIRSVCALSGILLIFITEVRGHGRLMEPPNRSSLWRIPEFSDRHPPINYDDNQLFCGGFVVHHDINRGKCGLCGDEYNMSRPRTNEHLGEYGKGIISRRYKRGQDFLASVELTFGHLGYFEFRLCKVENDTQPEADDCFDQYLLSLADGSGTKSTKFLVHEFGAHWYNVSLTLPKDLICEHCVLQWNYVAGNNYGNCNNGTSGTGCGPQETFRGCSDIAVDK